MKSLEAAKQRCVVETRNAPDSRDPEKYHSVTDVSALEVSEDVRRARVKWPAMANKAEWAKMDEELDFLMENCLRGSVTSKISILNNAIYEYIAASSMATRDSSQHMEQG